MRATRATLLATTALAVVAPAADAKKIVTHSADSLAPKNAPAHWLPPEAWVYNHWLPYDEGRLYRLLGVSRAKVWLQLRNDHRTIAQLAARHGYRDPKRLAARLVATRKVSASMRRVLAGRAERTLTQGHLAQHLLFHSLHQFAIASAAPELFGVTDTRFRELRRRELSPLEIARLHGRAFADVEAQAIEVLRDRMHAGVASGSISSAQARLLIGRQLTQLPRWLDQQRYNGPPTTHLGALTAVPQDYASNPAISADGRYVAYEAYRQKLPLALRFGEIAVLRADLLTGGSTLLSRTKPASRSGLQPESAYNPSISGDGQRVVYENSAGNQNFAKRYGPIGVFLCDLGVHGADAPPLRSAVDERPDVPALADSKSAYNPVVAGDGQTVVYEAIIGGRTSIVARNGAATSVVASGTAVGGLDFSDLYEPGVSADGARVVMTRTRGRMGRPQSASSSVVVRDRRTGRTIVASRADDGTVAGATSGDGAMSPDGRFVAFTSRARELGVAPGQLGLFVRDLDAGRTRRIALRSGLPLDPVVARDGTAVAYTVDEGSRATVRLWHAATGRSEAVSRGVAGVVGGRSEDPSISDDGTRVAFTSDARGLAPGPVTPRAVYVRDTVAQSTTRVSDTASAYPGAAR